MGEGGVERLQYAVYLKGNLILEKKHTSIYDGNFLTILNKTNLLYATFFVGYFKSFYYKDFSIMNLHLCDYFLALFYGRGGNRLTQFFLGII